MERQEKSGRGRFLYLSIALALCGFASWEGLVRARNEDNSTWIFIFGFLCVTLLLATVFSVASPLVQQIESSPRRTEIDSRQYRLEHGEYVATFSKQDRACAVLLAGAFVLITIYLWIHPSPLYLRWACSGMLAIFLWISYRLLFTIVRFTNKLITVHKFPFEPYSKSYRDVESLDAYPGNLRIRFVDGKKLDLWAGLGDAGKIVSILQRHVEVSPKIANR